MLKLHFLHWKHVSLESLNSIHLKERKKNLDLEIEKQLYTNLDKNNVEWEIIRAKIRYLNNSRCAVTNEYITGNNSFHVHHIVPKKNGGNDDIENLVLLKPEVHQALHRKDVEKYYVDNQMYQKLLRTLSKYK